MAGVLGSCSRPPAAQPRCGFALNSFPVCRIFSAAQFSMAEKTTPVYDESKIKTLSSLEHIRLRTGMYIGRIGTGAHPDDGCYVLLKEVVDNAIDEYIMGHGKEVEIRIADGRVSVRDFGRGIPLGKVVD